MRDLKATLAETLAALDDMATPEYQAQLEAERSARAAEDERRAEKARRDREARDRATYLRSVPVAVAERALAADDTPALVAARKWFADGCPRHLVLLGGVGCGKTTAACVVAKLMIDAGRTVSWLRPDQLVSAVMHSYDENAPKLHRCVVVDDMGRETKSDFAEALCELLDGVGRTVVITSNLKRPQFRERYDLRLVDRMNESCMVVEIKGASRRRQDAGL